VGEKKEPGLGVGVTRTESRKERREGVLDQTEFFKERREPRCTIGEREGGIRLGGRSCKETKTDDAFFGGAEEKGQNSWRLRLYWVPCADSKEKRGGKEEKRERKKSIPLGLDLVRLEDGRDKERDRGTRAST